jgi:hypothetical protein
VDLVSFELNYSVACVVQLSPLRRHTNMTFSIDKLWVLAWVTLLPKALLTQALDNGVGRLPGELR